MRMEDLEVLPGDYERLGAYFDGEGVNFSIFSENAHQVELCLFERGNEEREFARIKMEKTYNIWHCYIRGLKPGQLYAYRVHGEYNPQAGHRFNPNKLLLDPYARAIAGEIRWDDAVFGYVIGHPDADLSYSTSDSAPFVPKCVVVDESYDWEGDTRLRIPYHKTIIYELHVRGFTILNKKIPPELRGTYAGLSHPAIIDYLTSLGITAVELMPVHHFIRDRHLIDKGLTNYWGYNSIGYFAPHSSYSSSGVYGEQVREFKDMVKAFHRAGIEVILDVVFNHTGEGNHLGPTICFKGIDNLSYYRLVSNNRRYYMDYTGTGNTLNMMNPYVLKLIMDSLRYWILEMHVDGFRFDLASALARELHEVDQLGAFFDIIHQDPVISQVKLIAEPWDLGEGGYQVGKFPPGWSEWNGKYRDCIRTYWKGHDNTLPEFALRFTGSPDLYSGNRRLPTASINYVTCHDGFTLEDLVSYNHKHNEANLEGNRDGEEHNNSWNCGIEGKTDDPNVLLLRQRQKKNFLATLLLSMGVPMLLGGDEFGRTQGGNNNAYCQDNEISWVNWDDIDEELLEFTRSLIALRKNHPVFSPPHWFQGKEIIGKNVTDIAWFMPNGREMSEEAWRKSYAKSIGIYLNGHGLNIRDKQGKRITDDDFYIIFNAHYEPLVFTLPDEKWGRRWLKVIDTSIGFVEDYRHYYGARESLVVEGRSVVVFVSRDFEKRPGKDRFSYDIDRRRLGVSFNGDEAEVLIWAPNLSSLAVEILSPKSVKLYLEKLDDEYFYIKTSLLKRGSLYRFILDGREYAADPVSLYQPAGVFGPSMAIDVEEFKWSDRGWRNLPLDSYIIYELHVGTFTDSGTFEGVIGRLDYLRDLGVTAIELMPISQFSGKRNWGYDGVFPFAVQNSYGGPFGLMKLVDECHRRGIAVILDFVCNHLGPEGNILPKFGPFLSEKYSTPWGRAINFDGRHSKGVRRYYLECALMWLRDFHVDGLRLDATHEIYDMSPMHFLSELSKEVERLSKFTGRDYYLFTESLSNDLKYIRDREYGGYGLDAMWCDDFYRAIYSYNTGIKKGYFIDYGGLKHVTKAISQGLVLDGEYSEYYKRDFGSNVVDLRGNQLVIFLQNHDTVGNHPSGKRLIHEVGFEKYKMLISLFLSLPYIPLIFMGDEYGEKQPFLFFTDFSDIGLSKCVYSGRKRELEEIYGCKDIEKPYLYDTFYKSKLSWKGLNETQASKIFELYKYLIKLKKTHPLLGKLDRKGMYVNLMEKEGFLFIYRKDDINSILSLVNFSDEIVEFKIPRFVRPLIKIFDTSDEIWLGSGSISSSEIKLLEKVKFNPHSHVIYSNIT